MDIVNIEQKYEERSKSDYRYFGQRKYILVIR